MKISQIYKRISVFTWLAWLWPPIYFSNFILPFFGNGIWRLANDFGGLYHDYKIYLFAALSSGHFPLWSPSEGGGVPFFANPFASVFYPLNILISWVTPLTGHYPGIVHQWFTLFGVSIFCFGLFRWLVSLGYTPLISLLAAMVISVELKIADILRFPNAVHAIAWIPWMLYYLNHILFNQNPKRSTLLLTATTVCFMLAGYPYFIYHAVFLFLPYLAFLSIPKTRKLVFDVPTMPLVRFFSHAVVAAILALLLTAPYFSKVLALMNVTSGRENTGINFSSKNEFDWDDTLGSLFFPPAAITEGIYYFGMAALFLILFEAIRKPRKLQLCFLSFWIFITLITYGKGSPLFVFFWHFLPKFSALRVWSRLNIMLLPMLAWCFADSLKSFAEMLKNPERQAPTRKQLLLFGGVALVILGAQWGLYSSKEYYDVYWTRYMSPVMTSPFKETHSLIFGWLSFFSLMGLCLSLKRPWNDKKIAYTICLVAFLSLWDLSIIGRFFWAEPRGALKRYIIPTDAPATLATVSETTSPVKVQERAKPDTVFQKTILKADRKLSEFETRTMDSFRYKRKEGHLMISHTPVYSVGTFPAFYFARFTDFLAFSQNEPGVREKFLGVQDGQKLFASRSIQHEKIADFLKDTQSLPAEFAVHYYNGDYLKVETTMASDGYVSFIDNWDPDWEAQVDSNPVKIEKLFGTFKSVFVPSGTHVIEFKYNPKWF